MSKKSKPDEMPLASPRTRNIYLKSLIAFLNWAKRDRRVTINPLDGIQCENEQVDVRHRRTAFTDEEFGRLYNAALTSNRVIESVEGSTRALAYWISAYTGLRRAELASLTPLSIKLDGHPHIVVRAACSKRRREDRLPLPGHMVPRLQEVIAGWPATAQLFPKLEKKKTHMMIKRDLAAAGLTYRNADREVRDWHALRHTFVTRAWQSGASPHVVKELARHADFRTTLQYSHTTRQDLQDAMDAIPKLPV